MSISIPDFSDLGDLTGDFGPIPPGVASLFANPPSPVAFSSPSRTSTPLSPPLSRRSDPPSRRSGSTIPYISGRLTSPSSHGSTVRSKNPPPR